MKQADRSMHQHWGEYLYVAIFHRWDFRFVENFEMISTCNKMRQEIQYLSFSKIQSGESICQRDGTFENVIGTRAGPLLMLL